MLQVIGEVVKGAVECRCLVGRSGRLDRGADTGGKAIEVCVAIKADFLDVDVWPAPCLGLCRQKRRQ